MQDTRDIQAKIDADQRVIDRVTKALRDGTLRTPRPADERPRCDTCRSWHHPDNPLCPENDDMLPPLEV